MVIKASKLILSLGLAFALGAGVANARPVDMPLGSSTSRLNKAVRSGVISRGSRGSAVRELQAALKKHGYSVSVDGVFGRGTEKAVKAFQRSRGLKADGLVGKGTLSALKTRKATARSSSSSNSRSTSNSSSNRTRTTTNNDGAEDRIGRIFGLRTTPNTGSIRTPIKRGAKGESVKAIQQMLRNHGYSISVDGDYGSGTRNAVRNFQRANGLSADGVVGRQTLNALRSKPRRSSGSTGRSTKPGRTSRSGTTDWMKIARAELGVREVSGRRHTARIQEYHVAGGLGRGVSDETAWCSSFTNWVMKRAGLGGTNRANARSWLNYGRRLSRPVPGCIVIFWRESPRSWKGHVAFYVGDNGGSIKVLGGNQRNSVNIQNYSKSRVLGYRWPNGVPMPR